MIGAPLDVWFTATRRMDPSRGAEWTSYVAFSKLTQLKEVVTLDSSLCPVLLGPPKTASDWDFLVTAEGFSLDVYADLAHVERKLETEQPHNILALVRDPREEVATADWGDDASDFEFIGYDLIELATSISALTNCGGFPQAFDNSELSHHGLLPSHARTRAVQKALRAAYPEDPHAHCELWAIWRQRLRR